MKIHTQFTVVVTLTAMLAGCSKANHESTELSRSQTSNTNSIVLSGDFTNSMRVAASTLTNAVGDIKESAGAEVSELRSYTDRLRSSIQSDPALSVDWQKIQMTTDNGKIVLTGTVRSEAERQAIVSKAREIVGSEKLQDRLVVSPSAPATAPAPSSEPKK